MLCEESRLQWEMATGDRLAGRGACEAAKQLRIDVFGAVALLSQCERRIGERDEALGQTILCRPLVRRPRSRGVLAVSLLRGSAGRGCSRRPVGASGVRERRFERRKRREPRRWRSAWDRHRRSSSRRNRWQRGASTGNGPSPRFRQWQRSLWPVSHTRICWLAGRPY